MDVLNPRKAARSIGPRDLSFIMPRFLLDPVVVDYITGLWHHNNSPEIHMHLPLKSVVVKNVHQLVLNILFCDPKCLKRIVVGAFVGAGFNGHLT